MRLPIVCALLLTIPLGGCGVSGAGAPLGMDETAVMASSYAASATAMPTFDQAAFQEQMDRFSNEATIVAATMAALRFDPSADPAVATDGSGAGRGATVTVNGVVAGALTFADTGGWTTWETETITLSLSGGTANALRITANTASGGPNVDKVTATGP